MSENAIMDQLWEGLQFNLNQQIADCRAVIGDDAFEHTEHRGQSLFQQALSHRNKELVRWFFQRDKQYVNKQVGQWRPYHYLVREDWGVDLLLEYGLIPEMVENEKISIIHACMSNNREAEIERLVSKGFTPNSKNGHCILGVSVSLEWFKKLRELGATLVANGESALNMLGHRKEPWLADVIKDLSTKELRSIVEIQSPFMGQTLLHYAAIMEDLGLVKVLIKSGAKLNVENANGKIPYEVTKDESLKKLLRLEKKQKRAKWVSKSNIQSI